MRPDRRLIEQIQRSLEVEAVEFPLSLIDLERCSEFQKRVLLATHEVPKGRVSTYGRIARSLGVPGAARAVGTALAENPFPIIIPCHRAIRSNGELGGFRGGLEMKRRLLDLEGVKLTTAGKVLTDRLYCRACTGHRPTAGKLRFAHATSSHVRPHSECRPIAPRRWR